MKEKSPPDYFFFFFFAAGFLNRHFLLHCVDISLECVIVSAYLKQIETLEGAT